MIAEQPATFLFLGRRLVCFDWNTGQTRAVDPVTGKVLYRRREPGLSYHPVPLP